MSRPAIFRLLPILLAALWAAPLFAGVVYEIEVKDHEGTPTTTELMVEGKNLKMGVAPRSNDEGSGEGEAIYRGDRREMVIVDHDDQSYTVLDSDAVAGMAGQVQSAMKEVEKAMEGLDPKQREMVEKMMKERMPQGAMPGVPPVAREEVRKTGERATHNGYPCVRYDVFRGDEKVRELWVTDWSNVEGGGEVRGAFTGMVDFYRGILEQIQGLAGNMFGGGPNPFNWFTDVEGFPVVTRSFEGGELDEETTLRSARRRTLDPADFEPPAGYKRRSMGPQ